MESPLPGAQGLDSMLFLGEIDQIEIHGEGGGRGPRCLHRERRHDRGQPARGVRLARPARLGESADLFFRLEESGRFLGAEHLTQRLPEQIDGGREIHYRLLPPRSLPSQGDYSLAA